VSPPVPGPSGRLDAAACYRYCEALARAHHENFPVASTFLPERLRPHIFALYAFVRTADDIADEPAYAGRRPEELDRWDDLLHRVYHGEADHPIFYALRETVKTCDLPINPLRDILMAFRMDLRVKRYSTWNDLRAYVTLAAHPIGRMLLYVFGYRDAERHRYADDLSTALALTNFWQDVGRDLGRDRVYLPKEDLVHFGVKEDDLFARRESPRLAALIKYQCARTRALYARSRPLLDLARDDLGIELAMIWHGGSLALSKIEDRANFVFGPRVRLTTADKAYVLSRALFHRGRGLLSRFLSR
jgi:squalene synthase HpnC